jgi:hypothetical protein
MGNVLAIHRRRRRGLRKSVDSLVGVNVMRRERDYAERMMMGSNVNIQRAATKLLRAQLLFA